MNRRSEPGRGDESHGVASPAQRRSGRVPRARRERGKGREGVRVHSRSRTAGHTKICACRTQGSSPTANGVSFRPFFLGLSGICGFEELGRFAEFLCFPWPQTQGPKDFLGFGLRTKMPLLRAFRGYRFFGRSGLARLAENWRREERQDGDARGASLRSTGRKSALRF